MRASTPVLGALLSLLLACGGKSPPATESPAEPEAPEAVTADAAPAEAPEAPEAAPVTRGPGGLPMPADAGEGEKHPGNITMHKVPRGKDAVMAEIKAMLAADGWTIDSEEVSPRGAIRMNVSKDGVTVNVRLTGDDTQAALIITAP